MYTLYVIPGSHACRAAILMLEHKGVPYKRVDFVTGLHPLAARLRGFEKPREQRTAGGKRPFGLRIADSLGTVPALKADEERISTNHRIARFLDERHPEPPLFPDDPDRRAAVEEAERWADEKLQMEARRIPGAAIARDPGGLAHSAGEGRLGYLLYKRELARRLLVPRIIRGVFATRRSTDRDPAQELPEMLDRVDAWIEQGVLNGEQLNVADFMVAPSLALILYREDVTPMFEGRPALELVDRLLPAPA